MKDIDHVFLKGVTNLTPEHAVAAIIHISNNKYLLQHRDDKEEIFYPGHWGCFGGAIENNESKIDALKREMHEELELNTDNYKINYFTEFSFDYSFAGIGVISRYYYLIEIDEHDIENYKIHEGKEFGLFGFNELCMIDYSIPYDFYAIWMHNHKHRFVKH